MPSATRPEPSARLRARGSGRGWALALVLTLVGGLGCTSTKDHRVSSSLGPDTAETVETISALRVRGKIRGPLPGIGPGVELDAIFRRDLRLRADLRYERQGQREHEVLVWTPELSLLFDRHRGRFAELGEASGGLEAFGTVFSVAEAWFLLFPATYRETLPEVGWTQVEGQWRGRSAGKGYRRPVGPAPAWAELVWRDSDAGVHRLRVDVASRVASIWGPVAARLEAEGTDLEARLTLEWEIESYPALGDSILDPLWEPEGL